MSAPLYCHELDNYEYCRRCGLPAIEIIDGNLSCTPPDPIVLVNLRLAAIVKNNRMESDVQWAVKSIVNRSRDAT